MDDNASEILSVVAQLRGEIDALKLRVSDLEHQASQAIAMACVSTSPTEEEMLAIAAAVSAFLGVRARIQQVRLVRSSAWAQVGRMGVHASHHTH